VELTAKELGAYADAVNAVGKVAEKPKDATYAGYLAQFKKDREAIDAASKTPEEASEKDAKETAEAQARCISSLAPILTSICSHRRPRRVLSRSRHCPRQLPISMA
jgi:hypothetical protein